MNADLRRLAIEFAQDHPFLSTPDEAAGRCFWSTMRFAWVAADHGHQVEVICWRIANDPDFTDHWAVILLGGQIVDLTRAQVDGQTGVFWRLKDYPGNYYEPRRYPASLLLDDFQRQIQTQNFTRDGQHKPEYMARVYDCLAKFDAARYPSPAVGVVEWATLILSAIFLAWLILAY